MLNLNRKNLIKYAITGLTVVALVTAGFFLWNNPKATSASWWNDAWAYRKAININGSKINGNLTNFPILVSLTDSDLSSHAQQDGDDIVFTDAKGEKLKHEIEKYASSTGELVAWVKMPELASSTDTYLYMYYGNAGVPAQEIPENVWDDNYVNIWHLNNATGATTTDSTKYGNNGEIIDSPVSGSSKIDGGMIADQASDVYYVENYPLLSMSGDFQVSFWMKTTGFNSTNQVEVSSQGSYSNSGFEFIDDGPNQPYFLFRTSSGGGTYQTEVARATVNDGNWHYIVGLRNSNMSYLFVDGNIVDSAVSSITAGSLGEAGIGVVYGVPTSNVYLDEYRMSNISREPEWIKTEYNNQNSTTTFYSVQSQETGPGPIAYWSFNEGYGSTVHDSTANKYDGTLSAGTSTMWQSEDMCVVGKCLSFDGVNDKVTVSPMNLGTVHSASAWINWQDTVDGVVIGSLGSPIRYLFYIDQTNIYYSPYPSNYVTVPHGGLAIGQWYFISVVRNGTSVTFYKNGVQLGSTQTLAANDIWTDTLYIGSYGNGNFPTKMKLDEVKIYPYARSADQVNQDYVAGLSGQSTAHGVAAAFGSASDKWMSDGLVGYWKMDESATTSGALDSSGNGNNGTFYGHASTTGGKFGKGGVFDGTDDYLSAPDHASLDLESQVTVSAWIRPTVNQDNGGIVDKGGNYIIQQFSPSDEIYFSFYDGEWRAIVSDNANIQTGVWYFISATLDEASGLARIYINGVLNHEEYTAFNMTPDSSPVFIGTTGASEYFNGLIDEVRIYNRALSADEVRKLYEWAPGPVARWQFDEMSGNTVYDSAASTTYSGGRLGTLGGGTAGYMPSWTNGKYGSALNFDGTDDRIDLDGPTLTNTFTASMWIYHIQDNTGPHSLIIDSGNYYGIIFMDDSAAACSWKNVINFYNGSHHCSNTNIPERQWHHIAVVNNAGSATFYLDGIPDGTAAMGSYAMGAIQWMGYSYSDENFKGKIDDVRIYNYARTQKQILDDMYAGAPGLHPVLDLSFDEGSGATAYDKTIFKNNGALQPGSGGTNTASSAMWTLDGKNGKAIEFDGSDDEVVVPDSNLWDFGGKSATVSLWFQSKGTQTATWPTLMHHYTGGPAQGWYMQYVTTGVMGRISFVHGATTNGIFLATPSTYTDTNWHQVTAVIEYEKLKATLYIDGLKSVEDTFTADLIDFDKTLEIGGRGVSTYGFNGLIDDVKIYPYALNENEVNQNFNQNKSAVMGSSGKSNTTASSSNSAGLEYCVPGSTDYCTAPVGEWKFEEFSGNTAYDTSGSGYNGTLGNGTAAYRPAWTRGKIGSALSFDGTNDYVSMGDVLDFNYNGQFTVSAWIKPSSLPGDDSLKNIVSKKDNEASYTGWNFTIYDVDNGLSELRMDYVDNGGSGTWAITNSYVIANNSWQHVVGVYNNEAISFYLNGIYQDSTLYANSANSSVNNAVPLCIGCDDNGTDEVFSGLIDQVRIYNYARTPAQVAYEFNRGKPIAYWKFDECSGSTIVDSAKSWNGGTANNGLLYLGTSGVTATGTCASSSNSFWSNGSSGKYNSSGSFDGTDDYVNVGNFTAQPEFSISYWCKLSSSIGSNAECYISKYNNQENFYMEWIVAVGTDKKFIFASWEDGYEETKSKKELRIGQWEHILATFDSANIKRIYINGELENTSAAKSTDINYNTEPIVIGAYGLNDGGTFFKGQFDEVKIFNYALTADQVKSDYAGGAVKFGN